MKVTELRLGNLVNEDVLGVVPISSLEKEYVWVTAKNLTTEHVGDEQDYHLDIRSISPIPLAEEWLLKFHLKEEIEKSVRFSNEITIYDRFLFIWKPEYKYWYVITRHHKEYLTKIEFVHEYQNFIYTLTDIELTIK